MLQLPPMPSLHSLHVMVIHFPIALLLLSPLSILISAVLAPRKGRPYMAAGLITLVLGTAALFIAVSSGHSAAELAERRGAVDTVLKVHEELGEETELVFAGLSTILSGMYFVPKLMHRDENRLFSSLLPSAFLALYTVGVLFLVNTAHAGGRIVHEFGVHNILADRPAVPEPQTGAADSRSSS